VFGSEFGRCKSEAVFSSLDVEGLGWLVHSIDAAPRLCTLESEMLLCLAIRSIVRCIKNEENEFCIIFGDFVVPGFFLDTYSTYNSGSVRRISLHPPGERGGGRGWRLLEGWRSAETIDRLLCKGAIFGAHRKAMTKSGLACFLAPSDLNRLAFTI
jgi:hypothetical protein